MAITFPRTFPDELLVAGLSFSPEPMIEATPLRSGKIISANLGPTLWRAQYRSAARPEQDFGIARAWYDTLLSAEAFYGYDILRQYPLAYSEGWSGAAAGFDGTGTLVSVNVNTKEVVIGGLQSGMVLSPGDYIAWDYSTDSRALHRVVAGGTAAGGGTVGVEIRPHVRTGYVLSPAPLVYLYRAAAKMIVVPGSYSEVIEPGRVGRMSFEAIQTL